MPEEKVIFQDGNTALVNLTFYFAGWEIHPCQLLQAGQQLNEPWGQSSSQQAPWLGQAASESTGAWAHHAQPHKGTWYPLCMQIRAEIMNWPSPELPLKRLKVSPHSTVQTLEYWHWKIQCFFYPAARSFFWRNHPFAERFALKVLSPMSILDFFFHRLHVDNTSLLVTHHTAHRGVRHSGDYLVVNPLFLLETFQGWSNSNHTEKKVKQTVQYYGNWLHLVQKKH